MALVLLILMALLLTVEPIRIFMSLLTITGLVIVMSLAAWQFIINRRRASFLKEYIFPSSLKREVAKRYPHLSEEELIRVSKELIKYFTLFTMTGKKTVIAMPSRVLDIAWHEFILNTARYKDFCEKGIGRYIHHTPTEDDVSATHIDGIRNTWKLACEQDCLDPKSPLNLPSLFAIDAELNIPDGFRYSTENDYTIKVETTNETTKKEYSIELEDSNHKHHEGCDGGCDGGD
jgi:hypothetical protein